jgi:hypothetical protein
VRHIRCRFVRPLGLSPWDDISLNSTVAHVMSLYGSRLKRCPFVHTCVVSGSAGRRRRQRLQHPVLKTGVYWPPSRAPDLRASRASTHDRLICGRRLMRIKRRVSFTCLEQSDGTREQITAVLEFVAEPARRIHSRRWPVLFDHGTPKWLIRALPRPTVYTAQAKAGTSSGNIRRPPCSCQRVLDRPLASRPRRCRRAHRNRKARPRVSV